MFREAIIAHPYPSVWACLSDGEKFEGISCAMLLGGWVWGDFAVPSLQTPVYMAAPVYALRLASGKNAGDWKSLPNAHDLHCCYVGDDPRVQVPGNFWVRHVQKQLDNKTPESGVFSVTLTPDGCIVFDVSTKPFAQTVQRAYGEAFGLPACEVECIAARSEGERLHRVTVKLPSAEQATRLLEAL